MKKYLYLYKCMCIWIFRNDFSLVYLFFFLCFFFYTKPISQLRMRGVMDKDQLHKETQIFFCLFYNRHIIKTKTNTIFIFFRFILLLLFFYLLLSLEYWETISFILSILHAYIHNNRTILIFTGILRFMFVFCCFFFRFATTIKDFSVRWSKHESIYRYSFIYFALFFLFLLIMLMKHVFDWLKSLTLHVQIINKSIDYATNQMPIFFLFQLKIICFVLIFFSFFLYVFVIINVFFFISFDSDKNV